MRVGRFGHSLWAQAQAFVQTLPDGISTHGATQKILAALPEIVGAQGQNEAKKSVARLPSASTIARKVKRYVQYFNIFYSFP
jgi:hypothetical protein